MNQEEQLVAEYCLKYKLMNQFNTDKNRNKFKCKITETELIFKNVVESISSTFIKNQLEENIKEFKRQIQEFNLFKNLENKTSEEICNIINENINECFLKSDDSIQNITTNNGINLKYTNIFRNISNDLLKDLYLEDFDFVLKFSKETILKTFEKCGILIDNSLMDIMESIMKTSDN